MAYVVDSEILKREGVYRPETFCTIQLYEPDFNQNNKMLRRMTMAQVEHNGTMALEHNGTMAPEQYGSWKNISAIMHALNKVLSFDIIQQYKIPAAMCSNDAKSCYD